MEIIVYCLPEWCITDGNTVSIVVAPPAEMSDSGPKYFTSNGAAISVNSSRAILASSASVPSSTPLYSVMKMLDKE